MLVSSSLAGGIKAPSFVADPPVPRRRRRPTRQPTHQTRREVAGTLRIPREFQFDTDEVDIERRGDEIILRPPGIRYGVGMRIDVDFDARMSSMPTFQQFWDQNFGLRAGTDTKGAAYAMTD